MICTRCGEDKPEEEFHKGRRGTGRNYYCKSCMKEYAREWNAKRTPEQRENHRLHRRESGANVRSGSRSRMLTPEKSRANTLRYMYKVDVAWYDQKLVEQGGGCACCGATSSGGSSETFHIDHDHSCCPGKRSCGKCIRGLLCNRCNLLLGVARDDVDVLKAAIEYLKMLETAIVGG